MLGNSRNVEAKKVESANAQNILLQEFFFAAEVQYSCYKCSAADSEYRAGTIVLRRQLHTSYKSRKPPAHIIRLAWAEG